MILSIQTGSVTFVFTFLLIFLIACYLVYYFVEIRNRVVMSKTLYVHEDIQQASFELEKQMRERGVTSSIHFCYEYFDKEMGSETTQVTIQTRGTK